MWEMNWGNLFANNNKDNATNDKETKAPVINSSSSHKTNTERKIESLEKKLSQLSSGSDSNQHRIMTSSQLDYIKVKPYTNFGNDFKRKSYERK